VLQCQKTKHVVQAFTCSWGNSFKIGDQVVAGTYYQKWEQSENACVYLASSQVVYLDGDITTIKCECNSLVLVHYTIEFTIFQLVPIY
jgi:hypothetical protein